MLLSMFTSISFACHVNNHTNTCHSNTHDVYWSLPAVLDCFIAISHFVQFHYLQELITPPQIPISLGWMSCHQAATCTSKPVNNTNPQNTTQSFGGSPLGAGRPAHAAGHPAQTIGGATAITCSQQANTTGRCIFISVGVLSEAETCPRSVKGGSLYADAPRTADRQNMFYLAFIAPP